MNKIILCIAFILFTLSSMAESININVHGNVVTMPCKIEQNSYLVDFKKINLWNYRDPAQTPWIDFSIKLIECPTTTKTAKFIISGTPDNTDNNYFINTGSSIGSVLQLVQKDNKKVIKNGTELDLTVNSSTNSVDVPLSARIIAYGPKLEPGTFRSHVEFTVIYP
ncbi:fimbrial protein [Providencia sp. Je.9.19]|uniref:fimbrial protein n=1 Tax=unclassified Providencia TaxID=2633465 RepID=UPI003DA93BF8